MTLIIDIIKGIFIGIANVIPGVSGGTMALSLGIYDKLIGSVSNLLKAPKKSILTLLPIIVGCGLGIVGFTYAIEYLLVRHTFVTCMTFVGLILGGMPVLYRSLKEKMADPDSVCHRHWPSSAEFCRRNHDYLISYPIDHDYSLFHWYYCFCHHGNPWGIRLTGTDDSGILLQYYQCS